MEKTITAVKGGATEAAQSVADSQAIRILEQEIREAKEELRKSDHARTRRFWRNVNFHNKK